MMQRLNVQIFRHEKTIKGYSTIKASASIVKRNTTPLWPEYSKFVAQGPERDYNGSGAGVGVLMLKLYFGKRR